MAQMGVRNSGDSRLVFWQTPGAFIRNFTGI